MQFRQAAQKSDETVDQIVTCLRKLAVHCEFANLGRELVCNHSNCISKQLRISLREDSMILDKILSKENSSGYRSLSKRHRHPTVQRRVSDTYAKADTLVSQYNFPRNRVNVVSVDCHGHTHESHVLLNERPATAVVSRTISPRCDKAE